MKHAATGVMQTMDVAADIGTLFDVVATDALLAAVEPGCVGDADVAEAASVVEANSLARVVAVDWQHIVVAAAAFFVVAVVDGTFVDAAFALCADAFVVAVVGDVAVVAFVVVSFVFVLGRSAVVVAAPKYYPFAV